VLGALILKRPDAQVAHSVEEDELLDAESETMISEIL